MRTLWERMCEAWDEEFGGSRSWLYSLLVVAALVVTVGVVITVFHLWS